MSKFRIVPLNAAYANHVRSSMQDQFGNTVVEQIATGKGPCRVSLKPFAKGVDKRLLLSYSPFKMKNAFNQPGPIFINAEPVEAYNDVHRFPPAIKADPKSFPLTLIGYTSEQIMACTQLVGDSDIDLLIDELFDKYPAVLYLHARNAEAGCYVCKIERCEG